MTAASKQNVPALRFPEFEGNWESQRIGPFIEEFRENSNIQDQHEVLTSARSGLVRQKEYYDNDRLTGRDNIAFNIIPPNYITYRSRSDDRRFFFNENTLGIKGIISTYYPVFRIRKGENKFFTILFCHHEREIGKHSVGTSQTVLSLKALKRIKLPIPREPEQKKIAAFFGAVDEKLAKLGRKQDLLADYKRGVMQQIFSQATRFKRDDGSDFPDWEKKLLGEVYDWVGTNSFSREMLTYESGSVQNIHYGDIHNKFKAQFRQEDEQVPYLLPAALAKMPSRDLFCRTGDLVIADASEDYADIGKAIEILSVRPSSLVSGLHTVIARPKNDAVVVGFSGYMFRSARLRRQIMRIAQGISVLGISKGNLFKLSIFLPHSEEQKKIADFLSAIDTKIEAVSGQISRMEALKKGFLQQMFV